MSPSQPCTQKKEDIQNTTTTINIKASILPFVVLENGTIALCLGKINHQFKWTASDHLYSDLGGRKNPTDRSVRHTASREFLEEGLGLIKLKPHNSSSRSPGSSFHDHSPRTVDKVIRFLDDKHYFAKVVTTKDVKNNKKISVTTYLCEAEFDEGLSVKFKTKRNKLLSFIDKKVKTLHSKQLKWINEQPGLYVDSKTNRVKLKTCYNEMEDLSYFSLDLVMYSCTHKAQYNRVATRLAFLHNCRLRFLKVLPALEKYQDYIKTITNHDKNTFS